MGVIQVREQRPYRGAHLSVEWQGGQCDRPMCSRRQGDITAIHIVQLMPRTRAPNTAVNSHCRGLNRREP